MNRVKILINKKSMFIFLNLMLLVALICLSLWGVLRLWHLHDYITLDKRKPNEHLFDFWNMFWTFISALAIPFSVISYLTTKSIEANNKLREQKRDLIEREIPKFWSEYNTYENNLNESNSTIISERKELSPETSTLVQHGISILLKINNIKKNSRNTEDMDDYAYLMAQLLSDYKDIVIADFTILSSFFDTLATDKNTDSYINQNSNIRSNKDPKDTDPSAPTKFILNNLKGSDSSNIMIIRTLDTSGSREKIVGNWKMSFSRAKNIKYIIAVTGNAYGTKTYLKTVKVSGFSTVGDRIRFKYEDILLDNIINSNDTTTAEMSKWVSKLVSNWNAINPIVYLPHLEYIFFQQIIYQTFEYEFSKKITENNTIKTDSDYTKLQIFEKFSELRANGFFRIRFRSNKLDRLLGDNSNEDNQTLAYTGYSHWYEIISDNQHDTIDFASVFFANKTTAESNNSNKIFNEERLEKFYLHKKTKNEITFFQPDDKNKSGYIIKVDRLSKSEVTDKESLNKFITNIFKSIERDIKYSNLNTD
ncbi:hypothetical protein [uncultured Leuconostoc sp.]|jgi:hypothetical protein|uniref:hypothetical protein n=1 Tax=uncultured Leuconostoc sp. TaxID=173262 RepID=UPI002803FD41|nr:hypothetical protein [uncultured Leuconostoc sp.]